MARPKNSQMKEKILVSVEKLITTKGVNDFSLQDVSDDMHISKGTLYYHYKSKDQIIVDIIKKHISELETDYEEWLNRHKEDKITKERFLDVVFYKGVKLFNRAKLHLYIINECLRDTGVLKEKYNSLWKSWQVMLNDGVKQVFPDVEDPEAFSYMLMLIIDGLTVREVLEDETDLDSRLVALLKKVY
ncbi:MAG: TetR/AcrR family transcriptional regulator [Bacilli bacterium]